MTLMKFFAGTMTGSLALLSEAGHNFLDIAASGLTYFAVREADKPADEEHPFGHAKIEAVAALAQTGFLFRARGGRRLRGRAADRRRARDGLRQCVRVRRDRDLDRHRPGALARPDAASRTRPTATRSPPTRCISPATSSPRRSCLSAWWRLRAGLPHADALAAIGVALFIGVAGFRLGRHTIDALIDAAPKGAADALRKVVENVPGVAGTDAIRLRRHGAKVVGELSLFVSRTLPLERVAAIKADVAAAIHAQVAACRARRFTANPLALDDETLLEPC